MDFRVSRPSVNTIHVETPERVARAIYLGPAVLVDSSQDEDTWYVVQDNRCTCKGFGYRGTCSHLPIARFVMTSEGMVVTETTEPMVRGFVR